MKLRVGELIPNTETPVGEGAHGAVRAIIRVDGKSYAAIVKRIPPEAVLVECFCGLLFRLWELPTPEPILIKSGNEIIFASLDVGYPNLKKRLGWSDTLIPEQKEILQEMCARIVCSWDDIAKAMAADEAIANGDRHLENFLWDGTNHAYIDHERSLGLWPQEHNIIAILAQIAQRAEEIQRSGVAAALVLDPSAQAKVSGPDGIDFSTYATFVAGQLQGLAARVLARFPEPKDLLSGANRQ
ncbi:hypothetical protein F3J16_14235 [Burkholderia sp. Ap-962]|uniref:hypothetical protein n=1 Tax=Burkholderia sp. Ap-962 TaxID=2608333 RepID=UPI00141E7643|nr:hypothetical protein [Burkholderia sp. Ap-962]NIF71330.1 hypothetical protein [Burkholderia sp. Ap-962]